MIAAAEHLALTWGIAGFALFWALKAVLGYGLLRVWRARRLRVRADR